MTGRKDKPARAALASEASSQRGHSKVRARKRADGASKDARERADATRPEPGSSARAALPWSVPLARSDVSETGRRLDLVADGETRAATARLAGLAALPRLEASFDVTPRGRDGLHVVGRVSATVGQTCVLTLEPVENEIDEPIDLVFQPADVAASLDSEVEVATDDAPEVLVGGTVDLGAIATEFLLLAIDPYPRKPGAVFQPPVSGGDDSARPFAALAALASGQRGDSEVSAHRADGASKDARKRADDTRPETGSSARATSRKGPAGGAK